MLRKLNRSEEGQIKFSSVENRQGNVSKDDLQNDVVNEAPVLHAVVRGLAYNGPHLLFST